MNTYEKNVALAKKEHPEIWYEYAADSAGVVTITEVLKIY